ncbi:putative TPR and ankyrin repeat-containing protein [Helianthus annuus]|nr:putative TPR and ankyrin repeat-containing protein [Helianthus annuus]
MLCDIYKSESLFEKAGNCFYLAKCYDLAVEEYAKAGAFAKCFSACTDGKLFETGFALLGRCGECGGAELQFLCEGAHYYFKMKDFESMMKFVRSFHEAGEIRSFLTKRRCFDELIFLEKEWGNFNEAAKVMHKGAYYYFSVKDFASMMKFVRSFYDKDKMRSFLTECWCLDELILLEKEWGNFEEAAKVARLKPDPMLEANLLHMGGLNKEASLIILWHVFSSSTIFQNVQEPFTQKDELLRMAISIARRDSNAFYQFVCHEADLLSHGETKEELLEKGLEFIYCYKENALAVSLQRVKTTCEIKQIETNVTDLIRSFLKSANRLKELLLLDEVCGEFIEAAEIGNKDEQSLEEAALSRLWYVFFGSLWACGRRAWPLKDFKHKTKLLDDAYAYVTKHPDSEDSALVHREIHVLSGEEISLSHMWRYLKETPQEISLRIHFLISRRILDVHLSSHFKVYASVETQVEDETLNHLEDRLKENIVSVEGLIYFWNYWKEMTCELINWSPTYHQGRKASKIHDAFIFNYFGVRKYDGDKYGRYVVLDAEAQWVKQTRPYMIRNGYLHKIYPCQFSSAASRYWCSELRFVAEKVFGKLQSLHAYSTEKNLSMHQQTNILTCYFEFVKSLHKCKISEHARLIVDKYFQLCVDQFSWNVSHINWKYAQSKEMMRIRRNQTFLNMLKEAIDIKSKSLKDLSCEQLGRISVVLLGCKLICFNADTKRKLRCSSINWRNLFRKLMNRDRSISRNEDLARSIHNILKETYSAGWQEGNDCMSPACFLYLMDRLQILSFCSRGYVFTTRSSCVEWLSYGECGMGSNGGSAASLDTMKNIHHSLASMVIKMLNSPDELMEWLRRSNELESSYPVLLLRLTVLLSLICANSELHYDHLYHQLGRGCIISSLPSEFSVTLINGMKEDRLLEAVAVACKMIDNPLVIVSAKEDFPKVPCAKFLNIKKPEVDEESLIEMLYHDPEAQESAAPLLSN